MLRATQVARAPRSVAVRATYETEKTEVDVDQIVKDLQTKVRGVAADRSWAASRFPHARQACQKPSCSPGCTTGWQWDRVENKTSVAVYVVGAVVALWLSSTLVSAVNSVPLVSARCS